MSNGLAPGHTGRHNNNSGLVLPPPPRSLCTCSHSLSPLHSLLTTSSCHSGTFVLLFPHAKPISTSELWLLPFPLSGMFLCRFFALPDSSQASRKYPLIRGKHQTPPPSLSPIIPFLYLCIAFTP